MKPLFFILYFVFFTMPVYLQTPHSHFFSLRRQDSRKFQAGSPTGGSRLREMPFGEEAHMLLRGIACLCWLGRVCRTGEAEKVCNGKGMKAMVTALDS